MLEEKCMYRFNNFICKTLNEYTFGNFIRKQKSITTLFPKFKERVMGVTKNGGVRLYEMEPNSVWHFKVTSGTELGLKYDVYLKFKNLLQMIEKFVKKAKTYKIFSL